MKKGFYGRIILATIALEVLLVVLVSNMRCEGFGCPAAAAGYLMIGAVAIPLIGVFYGYVITLRFKNRQRADFNLTSPEGYILSTKEKIEVWVSALFVSIMTMVVSVFSLNVFDNLAYQYRYSKCDEDCEWERRKRIEEEMKELASRSDRAREDARIKEEEKKQKRLQDAIALAQVQVDRKQLPKHTGGYSDDLFLALVLDYDLEDLKTKGGFIKLSRGSNYVESYVVYNPMMDDENFSCLDRIDTDLKEGDWIEVKGFARYSNTVDDILISGLIICGTNNYSYIKKNGAPGTFYPLQVVED